MNMAADCEVKFEIICKTQFGEQLKIVGNSPELGLWDPNIGIMMKTDDDNYPNWYTENPLMLPQGSKFQFKFVKIKLSNNQQEWEVFPNNLNRKYRTRYQSVTLKAIWNDFSGREVANKKYASSNIFSNNEIKVHKFKISELFVPYEQAGTDSSNESDDFGPTKKIVEQENNNYNNKGNYNNNYDSDHSDHQVKKKLQRLPHLPPIQQMQISQQGKNYENFAKYGIQNSPHKIAEELESPQVFVNQTKHPQKEIYSPLVQNTASNTNQYNQAENQHHQHQQQLYNMNHQKQFGTDEYIKNNAIFKQQQQHSQLDNDSFDSKKQANTSIQKQNPPTSFPKLPQKNLKHPQQGNIFKEQDLLKDQSKFEVKNKDSEIEEQGNKSNEIDEMSITINSTGSVSLKSSLKPQSGTQFSQQQNQSSQPSVFKNVQTSNLNDKEEIRTKNHQFGKKATIQRVVDDNFNVEQQGDFQDENSLDDTSDKKSHESSDLASENNQNLQKNKILPRKKQQFQDLIAHNDASEGTDNLSIGDPTIKTLPVNLGDNVSDDSSVSEEVDNYDEKFDLSIPVVSSKDNLENENSVSPLKKREKIGSMGKSGGTKNSLSSNTDDGAQTNLHSESSIQSKYLQKQKRSPTQQEIIFAEKLFQSSGHTLQTLFQEKVQKINERSIINQKYSFITSENDIVFEASEEFLVNMSEKDELCLATFFLPIIITYDAATDTLKDEIQESSLYYHFINSYSSLRWVGVLPNYSQIPPNQFERVTTYLISKYRFYPIFMENEMLDSFLNNFCFNMYDNIMTNQFDLQHHRYIEYNSKMIEEVKMISFRFAQQISKMIDDDSNIMIADYRIIFSIIYLSQSKAKKLSLAYFHDSQFPEIEKLQILPFGEKQINAILCANLISFMNFESAQNFLRYIRVKLKLPYESIRGNLRLIYMGNQIIIHIRNPGVNDSKNFDEYVDKIKQTHINPDNKILLLSVDTLHENNKIELKFKLFERFLHNHPDIKMQLIQIILPEPKNYSKLGFYSNKELQKSINKIANDIQKNFKSRNPLLVIYQNMPLKERIAYMKLADIFLKTSIFQENEIYPLEYILANQKHGFCLINKFGSSNYKQMRSCIPFNPSSYYEFDKNILDIDQLSQQLKEKVVVKDIEILNQFNSNIWIEKHIAELKKNARFMSQANMTGFNKGINFKKVAHQANFKQINVRESSELYRKTVRRLIIFGYVGTLVPLDKYMYIQAEEHQVRRHHQKPSEKIIDNLKKLCADKRNMVYIVTELSIDFMDEWFSDVKGLGLICENGYFHKVIQEEGKQNIEWVRLIDLDMSWKESVYRIMESYAVRTQGSSVEVKESSVLWKYNKISIDYGSKQAEQMILQLNPMIAQLKYLEISHHNESVEVRPTNLNKGIVAELLIERKIVECGKIDFILILGSSMTDEDMFCACQMFYRNYSKEFQEKFKPLYVTIGIKPSNAYYYIAFEEVEKLIELLVLSESFASFI